VPVVHRRELSPGSVRSSGGSSRGSDQFVHVGPVLARLELADDVADLYYEAVDRAQLRLQAGLGCVVDRPGHRLLALDEFVQDVESVFPEKRGQVHG
jgi:hypothetical protein